MSEEVILQIEKLVYGGEGLAHAADKRTVFVPFVLPGETVRAKIVAEKKNYARAEMLEIITASPKRISPRCLHFTDCGGCHYQHMAYSDQIEIKRGILIDQLTRIGGLQNPPLSAVHPSPSPWNYRNQVQFHPAPDGKLGFMDSNGNAVVRIHECHLPCPGVNELWPQIDLAANSGITRLSLREDSFGEQVLLLEGGEENGPELELDLPVSVAYINPDQSALTMAGQDVLRYSVRGVELSVSPESFFQVNAPLAEEMLACVLSHIAGAQNLKILELYSGVGYFSRFLAEQASQLTAIESSASACYDFVSNLDCFDTVSLYEGGVEQILPGLLTEIDQPDMVVLDPPRSGLHPRAREALIKLNSPKIIYISCDPSTLARDIKALCAAGYTLDDVQMFDMFPQTFHLETVAVMAKVQAVADAQTIV